MLSGASSSQVYTLSIIALACAYLLLTLKSWYRLRKFNGPKLAQISNLWMARAGFSGRMNLIYLDAGRKFGKLIRVGPNELMTSDPDLVRHISAARSLYTRSPWYGAGKMDPDQDNVMSTLDTARHDRLKSKLTIGYSGKENPNLEASVDQQVLLLVKAVERHLSEGSSLHRFDVAQYVQYFTLDVITAIGYGKAPGHLVQEADVYGLSKEAEVIMPFLVTCAAFPLVIAFLRLPWVSRHLGPSPNSPNGAGKLFAVSREVVGERFAPDTKPGRDMLDAFIRRGLSQKEAEVEVILQILAGSDTVATAIRSTILHLITAPRILDKLLAEIDTAISSGRISAPITNAEAKALPYLQACIKEGLRIHPPFTAGLPKVVPPGGDTFNHVFLPGGTSISCDMWGLQRNEVYGLDADIYRPERWTEAPSEQQTRMDRVLDLVFGYGRWGCLGRNIADLELNKVFVELLRRFDLTLIDPKSPWKSKNHNIFLQKDMFVRVTRREAGKPDWRTTAIA